MYHLNGKTMRPLFNPSLMEHVGMHVSHKKKDHKVNDKPYSKDQYQELIDLKKERAQAEKAKLPLYRNIGFTITFLLLILVFNWKFPVETLVDLGELEVVAEEIYDIPISEQPPPPPPKQAEVFNIVEVQNTVEIEEIEMNLDVEVNEQTQLQDVIVSVEPEIEEEKAEEIFSIVEDHPEPVGGMKAFLGFLAENIEYPRAASRLGVSGKVFVQFVVEKDGSLTDIKVIKGIGAGCDEEAVRVLSTAPKWIPGKQRGVPVRVYKMVPINFQLKEYQ